MTPRDYREAWAWVHLFLNGAEAGKPFLLNSLAELHEKQGKLGLAENGATNDRLLAHLKALQSESTIGESHADDRAVRLQDEPAPRSATAPSPRVLAPAARVDRVLIVAALSCWDAFRRLTRWRLANPRWQMLHRGQGIPAASPTGL